MSEKDPATNTTPAFLSSLVFNGVIGLSVSLLACLLLRSSSLQWVYEPKRSKTRLLGPRQLPPWSVPPPVSPNFLGWVCSVLRLSRDHVVVYAGLDAAIYTQFLSLGYRVFLVGCLMGCVILMPLNSTLGGGAATGLDVVSLTNVSPDSSRILWAHLLCAYCITAYIAYECVKLYDWFVLTRADQLERAVSRGGAMSLLVQNIPPAFRNDENLKQFFNELFPGKVKACVMGVDTTELEQLGRERWAILKKLEVAQNSIKKGKRPTHKTGWLGLAGKVDSIDHYINQLKQINENIEDCRVTPPQYLQDAVVTFTNPLTTLSVLKMPLSESPGTFTTSLAPEPRDIIWSNLQYDKTKRGVKELLGSSFTALLVLFWTIPVAFVASLITLESLTTKFPFLKPVLEFSPVVLGIIQGILPSLALTIFNAILPSILAVFTQVQGPASYSQKDMGTLSKFFLFQIINNFFIVAVGGALFDRVGEVFDRPAAVVDMLGKSIPKAGMFFINVIMLVAITGAPMQLLLLPRWLLGWFYKRNAKTGREAMEAEVPTSVNYAVVTTQDLFVFLVSFVFSVITPLMGPFSVLYFASGYLVSTYQSVYLNVPTYETHGMFWPIIFDRVIVILVVGELAMLGVFGLKKNAAVTLLMIPLLIVTVGFYKYIHNTYDAQAVYLTAERCVELMKGKVGPPAIGEEEKVLGAEIPTIASKTEDISYSTRGQRDSSIALDVDESLLQEEVAGINYNSFGDLDRKTVEIDEKEGGSLRGLAESLLSEEDSEKKNGKNKEQDEQKALWERCESYAEARSQLAQYGGNIAPNHPLKDLLLGAGAAGGGGGGGGADGGADGAADGGGGGNLQARAA